MKTSKKEKIVINGQLENADRFNIDTGGSDPYVYEVIRVIDGKVLFADEHFIRLSKSLKFIDKDLPFTLDEMIANCNMLIQANEVRNDNIKLIVDNFISEDNLDVLFTLMHVSYPSDDDYRNGVATDFFRAVRVNPQLKVRNQSLRDTTNEVIAKNGLFELILVDYDDNITEGSRSNIFFIKGKRIYTSPAETVLLGITRMKLIEICQKNGYEVIEHYIPADAADDFAAAFISGTSPKVLPIRRIGDVEMDVNNLVLRHVMDLFDKEITGSLTT